MPGKIDIDQSDNHIGGNFTWDTKPECCKNLIDAVEVDKFVFVSNFVFKIGAILDLEGR